VGLGIGVAVCLVATTSMFAAVLPADLKIEQVLVSTADLGDIEQSPLGELWLLEKTGTVRVFVNGAEQASLAISVAMDCESGLLDVAFSPDYVLNRLAFVYYVDPTGMARVDELFNQGTALELGANVLDLGTTSGGCRPGGGLDVGADGKLYVSVGDLETSGDAQDEGMMPGKVLRAELDGSIPGDNVSGTLMWAKGFRHGTDLEVGDTGTVYGIEFGSRTEGAEDEVNAIHEGDNHGWDMVSGDSGGTYDDPLVAYSANKDTEGVAVTTGDALGEDREDSLIYACSRIGEMYQAKLTGAALDELDGTASLFYDSEGDDDGTPDVGCPKKFSAVTEGGEGWLYGGNYGVNPGIWRVWHDEIGPRDVSAPGSPFAMTLGKSGARLAMGWEDLGPLDSGRPDRHGGQHEGTYQIWEGDLANVAAYEHTSLLTDDGTSAGIGIARRDLSFMPSVGDRYYLISAQGENIEGGLGTASDGTPRTVPGITDYCTGNYGTANGDCAEDWVNPSTGQPLKLTDYNPYSATYLQQLSLSDFRGKVIRMDLSANNCTFCRQQADNAANVEDAHHARDFVAMTVLTLSYSGVPAIPSPALCQSYITSWATAYGVHGPMLCDEDHNGDGHGDVSWQYWRPYPACGGTPHNYYIDQGHTIYNFVCGGELSDGQIFNKIIGEINPESCE
jgi:hypothetical protein